MTDLRVIDLPGGYAELLDGLKTTVRDARIKVLRTDNTQLIALYWAIVPGVWLQLVVLRLGSGVF